MIYKRGNVYWYKFVYNGSRRRLAGPLPTVEEFARAIADAASTTEKNGATIFVGSTE
jgi:hypothetical protein